MSYSFMRARSFNQTLEDWNVSRVQNMTGIFGATNQLSKLSKGKIHESFASNPNWPYDWRQHVVIDDSNFKKAVNLWFDNQVEANATYGHISDWNTSAVTDMSNAFKDRTTFNEDISGWDVSSVQTMHMIFRGASAFNQPIGDWNTSAATNMAHMFENASSFNQPIGNWDVSSVQNMFAMFEGASAFNQFIGNWNRPVQQIPASHMASSG